jgi:MFS family permease
MGAFVLVERRAAEPVLPGWALSRRMLATGNLSSLGIGALLLGLTTYVPTFAQGVLGTGALVAGFALAALTIGWPITAAAAGRVYLRIGFRNTAMIGGLVALVGAVAMALVSDRVSVWQIALTCFVVGAGMGMVNSPVLVAVQSVVGWDRRGVVTATNMFSRSIGSAVGVAVFGAIANATLGDRLKSARGGLDGADRAALFEASHHVFVAIAVTAALLLVAVSAIPRQPHELFPPPGPVAT